jgi:DNA topoisomerase-1
MDPQEVTVAQALELIAARAGKKPSRERAKKAASTKTAAEGATKPKAKPKSRKKAAAPEPVDG